MEAKANIDLQELGSGCMDWINLAHDRARWQALVTLMVNLLVPQNVGNFLTSRKPVIFSRRTVLCGVSDWVIIMKYYLMKWFCNMWTAFVWLWMWTSDWLF
jgi:hypothetical protein